MRAQNVLISLGLIVNNIIREGSIWPLNKHEILRFDNE